MSPRTAQQFFWLAKSHAGVRRFGAGAAGVLGTFVLHALLLVPLLFGAAAPPHTPSNAQGEASAGTPSMTVVLLEESPSTAPSDRSTPSLTLPTRFLKSVAVDVPSLSTTQMAVAGEADDGALALMFGRYLGQVTARVERAWIRPRSAIGEEVFACRVRVEQDTARNVQDVTLAGCNGTEAWQRSLVRAVQSASPLPAPPDPAVFSKTLVFELSSDGFQAGGSGEGFEPVTILSAQAAAQASSQAAFEHTMTQLRSREKNTGVIDLRITGSSAPTQGRAAPVETVQPEANSDP